MEYVDSRVHSFVMLILGFADIEDLPPTVQEKLFDEVLDRDVQKGKYGISIMQGFILCCIGYCILMLCIIFAILFYLYTW